MIEFARLWAFAALPLPVLAWFALPPLATRRSLRVPAGVAAMLVALSRDAGRGSIGTRGRFLIPAIGWFAVICALAGPQISGSDLIAPSGRDVLIAIDLSASMATQDMAGQAPDADGGTAAQPVERAALMREMVGAFINRRVGDRLALIGFATDAYLVVPLTHDVGAVSQTLTELRVGLTGRKTDLGRAIGLAVQVVKDEPAGERLLTILTDGQTNVGGISALDAADLAAEAGMKIHMIGFAAEIEPENARYMRDIAERTGGLYLSATTPDVLEQAYERIDASARPVVDLRQSTLVLDLCWIPILTAMGAACWLGWRELREE